MNTMRYFNGMCIDCMDQSRPLHDDTDADYGGCSSIWAGGGMLIVGSDMESRRSDGYRGQLRSLNSPQCLGSKAGASHNH